MSGFVELRKEYPLSSLFFSSELQTEFESKRRQLFTDHMERSADCRIYDSTGSLKVHSRLEFPNGSHFLGVLMSYVPNKRMCNVEYVINPEDYNTQRKEFKPFLWDLLPQGV